jgi:phosphoribosylanthranilate isomerase
MAIRDALALDRVQLHGDEPDSWLDTLGPETLRRVQPHGADPWQRAAMLSGRCLPLFDPGAGDGVTFDWAALRTRPTGLWIGLAGGLTPETVGDAVRAIRPALVDVSTGVESAPGVKDPERMAAFVAAARAAVESAALESR